MGHMGSDEFILTYIKSLQIASIVEHSFEFIIYLNIYLSLQYSPLDEFVSVDLFPNNADKLWNMLCP